MRAPSCECYPPAIWDFSTGALHFTTGSCDDQGVPVREHGPTTYLAGDPAAVWGTILEGDHLTDAGRALVRPAFTVGEETHLLEIFHYCDCENLWDEGNVKVHGDVLNPSGATLA